MRRRVGWSVWAATAVVCVGLASGCNCGPAVTPPAVDAGGVDAGGVDAGGTDAGGVDGGPLDAGAGDAGAGDAGAADAGNGSCGAPTGPTVHGITAGTETWTAAGSPHLVDSDLRVLGTLTIEPCAEVRIGPGRSITVDGPTSSLVAAGTALRPIHIGAHQPGLPFASLTNAGNGTLRLTHVTIEGGGAAGTRTGDPPATEVGTVVMQSQGSASRYELLFLDHVTVEGSASNGLVVRAGANFAAGSTDLVVHGAAFRPLRLAVSSLDAIPSGVYTGNTFDEVLVVSNAFGTDVFREHTTLRDLGVPYHVSKEGTSFLSGGLVLGGLRAADRSWITSTLTLEPGVTIRFESGAFHISDPYDPAMQTPNLADAVLHAVGTASRPIVLTSAAAVPAPGDWAGLSFAAVPDPLNSVAFVRVEYAGAKLDEPVGSCVVPGNPPYAAIRIHGRPASQFITQTTIFASSTNGIDRGWRAPVALDFLPTNTFVDVTGCNQTMPPDAVGACPLPVPCPK